jgi:hypothetical protein
MSANAVFVSKGTHGLRMFENRVPSKMFGPKRAGNKEMDTVE